MVKTEHVDNVETYRCEECGLHYTDRAQAEVCEGFGETYGECNAEVARDAVENRETDDVTF